MTKVSTVIPVYNRPLHIRDAVETVLAQHYKDNEIIVVDDASDAGVYRSLKPYLPLLRYIRLDRNSGVSAARNAGIVEANGEYIAFLDSDDLWLPFKLRNQIPLMEQEGTAISHTNEFWFRKDRFINQGNKFKRYGGFIFDKILDICRISPSSLCVRADAFRRCGMFNEDMRVCEDYEFFLRICAKEKVSYLELPAVIKRAVTNDQLSTTIKHIESIRLLALLNFLNHNGELPSSLKRKAMQEVNRKWGIVRSGISKGMTAS
ncbi:glycosyltransferase family 2 protein [Limisalsivibrio acetivorans]|uniref:glycosyltransferase family 2 protein n=1 Tax=Limisalsivibrio acetivorans TaxID=1304888 RepID=UPI0003B47C5D|nr:glycosyltransferase family A protein [Limisalsivibrio acetivorans]